MNLYNEHQTKKIVISAAHYGLDASEYFWKSEYADLAKVCNGCGPECMSMDSRKRLTEYLDRYSSAYAIHDVDYDVHDDTRAHADKRLYANMVKIWKKDFGFWRWLSFAGIFNRVIVIPAVYSAVRKFGHTAWKATNRVLKMKTIICALVCAVMLTGCLTVEERQEIKDKAHTAIIQYLQSDGKDKAIAYIDKLVAEGKLGAKNAEKLKEALPKGIEKLKEVMGETEKEEESK